MGGGGDPHSYWPSKPPQLSVAAATGGSSLTKKTSRFVGIIFGGKPVNKRGF